MRTSGSAPPAAASACSISVWPGKREPAAASACLCTGAVTSALARPPSVKPAAASMHAMAARPASACTWPIGKAARAPGKPGGCHTAMQRGGARRACSGVSNTATGHCRSHAAVARRITATSPTTTQGAGSGCTRLLTMTSGPMPQGSPIVNASSGLVWLIATQAGLGTSMKWCSRSNTDATCCANAGAPKRSVAWWPHATKATPVSRAMWACGSEISPVT